MHKSSCHSSSQKVDYLLWTTLILVIFLYFQAPWLGTEEALPTWYRDLLNSTYSLVNKMWWSVAIGVCVVSMMSKIPREFVIALFGTNLGFRGICRATAAGVLLDLCSHGILMVGAKLYERGVSIGQVMAFLIASPWNSFSLTLILISLVGLSWTLLFIVLSMAIAVVTGCLFDTLVTRGKLPPNRNQAELPNEFSFWQAAKNGLKQTNYDAEFFKTMFKQGIHESRMVIRWILFGIVLAGLVRAFFPPDLFGTYFGPTLAGLGLTVLVATILEVCSEGSTPIAADLLNRANAPGNGFAFLMTGVATDYTEIMVLKDATKSWKISLMLPVLTVPQVLIIAWLINHFSI